MKIQYKALSLLNLISITQIVKKEDWLLPAIALRNQVVHNGIYAVGPVLLNISHWKMNQSTVNIRILFQ